MVGREGIEPPTIRLKDSLGPQTPAHSRTLQGT